MNDARRLSGICVLCVTSHEKSMMYYNSNVMYLTRMIQVSCIQHTSYLHAVFKTPHIYMLHWTDNLYMCSTAYMQYFTHIIHTRSIPSTPYISTPGKIQLQMGKHENSRLFLKAFNFTHIIHRRCVLYRPHKCIRCVSYNSYLYSGIHIRCIPNTLYIHEVFDTCETYTLCLTHIYARIHTRWNSVCRIK